MATRKRAPDSPSPLQSEAFSPTLSAVQSSHFTGGSLDSYPSAVSPFHSSPFRSSPVSAGSPRSPDLFEDFHYTSDMDVDLRKIDKVGRQIHGSPEPIPANKEAIPDYDPDSSPPTPSQDQRTWVVFRGRVPGLQDYSLGAALQTQGFSDAFQREYPDRASAVAAWNAYRRDGTYPDYGKSPWVVFHGRKLGVFQRVTELECSVKGHAGAIFQACSSVADGNVKFHLFAQRVAEMFAGPDPFSGAEFLVPPPAGEKGSWEAQAIQSTSTPIVPRHTPSKPQVAESSRSAQKRPDPGPPPVLPMRCPKIPHPGDGWYVAYNAILPGVYYGLKALKEAGPKPGGFQCVAEEEAANHIFYHFAMNDMITWAGRE